MGESFYYIIWGIVIALALAEKVRKKAFSKHLYYLFILVMALVVAGRYNVGSDWASYISYYYDGYDLTGRDLALSSPFFALIRYCCLRLGLTHAWFFLLISLASLLALYKASKMMGIKFIMFGFAVYLSLFFVNHQFNMTRQGLANTLVWLSFAYKSRENIKASIITLLLAAGIHASCIIFIPFLFFIDRPYTKKFVLFLVSIGFISIAFQLSTRIVSLFPVLGQVERVAMYLDKANFEDESYGLTIGVLFNVLLFVISYLVFQKQYLEEKGWRVGLNGLLWAFFIVCILNAFPTFVTRIGNCLNISLVFVIPLLIEKIRKTDYKIFCYVFLLFYLLLYYPKSFGKKDSMMIPYNFEINQFVDKSNW